MELKEKTMNRIAKTAAAAAALTFGLAVFGLPLSGLGGDGGATTLGSSGCCRQ